MERRLRQHALDLALFNLPPGDWASGERGIAALPNRFEEFRSGVDKALDYAQATGARSLHMMAGLADPSDADTARSYRRAVDFAAPKLAAHGLNLLLEPINGRSMPGYLLNDFARAAALIEELDQPNLRLQFDVFHRQIMHGDITESFRCLRPMIGHVQIAGVPARHEPDAGEVDYRYFFELLERSTYSGFVGCEYQPAGSTTSGLGWFTPYRRRRK
ncbi:hydroxypyruvate isomerase [Mesorhizobium hawassense]|uniref:Hydroxypyruvate isomerase n=1 Tax=Mesorhizobium hawassense TaxID=1209954 RepID=A0A330HSY3_9HYPH|nr:TIM barrel protein [Mesorhizobium hawassense]RAZ90880.1 hydroxypyruvate isomerase [Mesorhizobium hawassense]